MTNWPTDLDASDAATWLDLFALRRDAYAVQTENGGYNRIDGELNEDVVWSHLWGEQTIGVYALDRDKVIWSVLDSDYPGGTSDLQRIGFRLKGLGFDPVLELSRQQGHLWLMMLSPVEGYYVRRLFIGLLNELSIPLKGKDKPGIEVFPKQDSTEGYGNLIRGPLGIHRKSGDRYPLADLMSLKPFEPLTVTAQLLIWSNWQKATPEQARQAALVFPDHNAPKVEKSERNFAPLDFNGLDILFWAGQFTELRRTGGNYVGRCPFHKPDTEPSFYIYANDSHKPHYHCFGCQAHGDAFDLKAHATGKPLAEVLREVRANASA
jgi:hypothetical protein